MQKIGHLSDFDEDFHPSERAQIRELIEKQKLYENIVEYCRGMDRKELDLMKSTFWPESTEDHGMYVGLSHEFCEWAMTVQKEAAYKAQHYATNVLIDLDGDQAKRETAFIYLKVPTNGEPTDMLCGRYRDLCERRAGEWKVLSRTCVWDTAQRLSAEGDFHSLFGIQASSAFGNLYPHDPIYATEW